MRLRRFIALIAGFLLVTPAASSADVGALILEPIRTLGYLTRAGHAAVYLSNICPDGSPIRLRLCHPGERGGVISKYTPISENDDYDWAIVPFDQFLNGVDSEALAPLIASHQLRESIQAHEFSPLFSSALSLRSDRELPDGEWKTTLATRFDRTIYNFSIRTTIDDDWRIVEAFNKAENRSHFNFFYDNCSDQTRAVFAVILPSAADIGDRTNGLSMQTPKGLAKALVRLAEQHPELQLHIERYSQMPGTAPRSRETLFPLENLYRNLSFAPYWFFGGFRELAIGAFLYHQLFVRFSVSGAYQDFATRTSASATADSTAPIGQGDARAWHSLQREYVPVIAEAEKTVGWPTEIRSLLVERSSPDKLAQGLFEYFEARGRFFIDEDRHSPWLELRLGDVATATGISMAEIGDGDPALSFLVLAAVVGYQLTIPEDRRDTVETVTRAFSLLRQASARLPRTTRARRPSDQESVEPQLPGVRSRTHLSITYGRSSVVD